jgi:hypothetical protein
VKETPEKNSEIFAGRGGGEVKFLETSRLGWNSLWRLSELPWGFTERQEKKKWY